MNTRQRSLCFALVLATVLACVAEGRAAYSLVMTNGYGDVYRMNLMGDRTSYQTYKGICSYRGFSLSGCSTTGEVVMLRIKETASMPEHFSIVSTSLRWGTTMYFLNDVFRWLSSTVMAGYENWYPFDMSCSVAMYINSGGFGLRGARTGAALAASALPIEDREQAFRDLLEPGKTQPELDYEPLVPKAYSLVMTNGYGDMYKMNLMRDRTSYQAYKGVCSYRGFSLSGCSTTGEVVMLRIKETASMPEHFSIVSTSLRWGTTMYFLNDVFRWLSSTVMAGYENWYPFDMSCSMAMYINSGGFGLAPAKGARADRSIPFDAMLGSGTTNVIGVLIPITGDLADLGASYNAAYDIALAEITASTNMPAVTLEIRDSKTDAATAYEQLQALSEQGVRVVLGPESSQECAVLLEYAEQNNILLISSSSTATQLAIEDDNLMRLTIDDSQQARALAELIQSDGITDIAIFSRTDSYGDGLRDSLISEFTALGGTVFTTNDCPRATDLIGETITNVGDIVAAHLTSKSANKVGFVAILFDEGVDAMESAASISSLSSIRWYGSEGMAQNRELLTNSAAGAFALQTRFACSAFGSFTNEAYSEVESAIQAQTGTSAVPRYPMSAYDALWLVTLALKKTGGTQTVDTLKQTIRAVATNYSGTTGPIVFNAADDRSTGSYDFWALSDANGAAEWVKLDGTTPDCPMNVAASNGEYSDKVSVSWNSISEATAYEVWRGTSSSLGDATLLTETGTTDYDDTAAVAGRVYFYSVKAKNDLGTSALSNPDSGWRRSAATDAARYDFDGDGRADAAVYSESSGWWYILNSGDCSVSSLQFGGADCVPAVGDYDGDGKSDPAVYDESTGYWHLLLSTTLAVSSQKFGEDGCVPAAGDFDGDGKSDLAVYEKSSGYWYVLLSGSFSMAQQKFGDAGWTPVAADYSGNGITDMAVYDETSGEWYILNSDDYSIGSMKFGGSGYSPAPADYDGDGKSDIAVYHGESGWWYMWLSVSSTMSSLKLGESGYEPVPGDFDGDGKADPAVYHVSSGWWYVILSETGQLIYFPLGGPGYSPTW